MSQPKRIGALHKFKSGDRNVLVATGKYISLQMFAAQAEHACALEGGAVLPAWATLPPPSTWMPGGCRRSCLARQRHLGIFQEHTRT